MLQRFWLATATAVGLALAAHAGTDVVYLDASVAGNPGPANIVDGAPIATTTATARIGNGAWQAINGPKTEIRLAFDPNEVPGAGFGYQFTIADIKEIRFSTNKSTPQNSVDWYLTLYTVADGVNDDAWYGRRLIWENLYANALNAPASQWNDFTTDGNASSNILTAYDSNRSGVPTGFFGAPTLADLQAGPLDWSQFFGSATNVPVDYSQEVVRFLYISTGNPWSTTFDGLLDAISIELNNGDKLEIDLEQDAPTVHVVSAYGDFEWVKGDTRANSVVSFVDGPAPTPLGDGSARLLTGATGTDKATIDKRAADLGSITAFSGSYWWIRTAGSGAPAPALKLGIDTSDPNPNTPTAIERGEDRFDKILVYEPYLNPLGRTIPTGVWTQDSVDQTTGTWWLVDLDGNADPNNSGVGGPYLTLGDWQSNPEYGAVLSGGTITSIQFGVGSGNPSIDSNVDRFAYTIGGPDAGDYVVNFEQGPEAVLQLSAASCQDDVDAAAGYQVAVDLSMLTLTQNVTGFQAFLTYDPNVLTYEPALSSYSSSPFPAHFTAIGASGTAPGEITLDGNVGTGGSPTAADASLATLVFTVNTECVDGLIDFAAPGTFNSFISFQGNEVATALIATSPFTLDDTAPAIVCNATSVDADTNCEATVPFSATITDNCCLDPNDVSVMVSATGATAGMPSFTVTQVGPSELSISGTVAVSDVTGCPASIDITIDAVDCCGNAATSCLASATVSDVTAPDVTCPSDISVSADAGGCDALVAWTAATALDNCSGDVSASIVYDIDENDDASIEATQAGLSYTFPQGTHRVTARAVDGCGNEGSCSFTVTVSGTSEARVTIELDGVFTPVTRCLHFVASPGDCGAAIDVPVDFIDDDADPNTPVRAVDEIINLPCGNYTALCVKDEQHTLYETVALNITGTQYDAAAVAVLRGGDTNNDSKIDINDVTWLLFQFGNAANAGGCPWDGTRDADFNNDTIVDALDYSFFSAVWLQFTTCACSTAPLSAGAADPDRWGSAGAGDSLAGDPIEMGDVAPLRTIRVEQLPPDVANASDLNHDGVVDWRDVAAFERANGLPNTLSRSMRGVTPGALQRDDAGSGFGRRP